jgi:hypothetical protein
VELSTSPPLPASSTTVRRFFAESTAASALPESPTIFRSALSRRSRASSALILPSDSAVSIASNALSFADSMPACFASSLASLPKARAVSRFCRYVAAAFACVPASPVMSANTWRPSTPNSLATSVGSGAAGGDWICTSGVGKGVGVAGSGSERRDPVLTGSIAGGSSRGDCSHRQNRESSIRSHALQAPMTASAKTPLVGRLTRAGGTGVGGA